MPESPTTLSDSPLRRAPRCAPKGGPLSDEECERFEEHPGFDDALNLRTWDDEGKVEGLDVGELRGLC